MSDLVSKEAVMLALIEKGQSSRRYKIGKIWELNCDEIREAIATVPSAEPERKKGKWIPQNLNKTNGLVSTAVYYYPKCSVCGLSADYANYCPHCGADMRGEE